MFCPGHFIRDLLRGLLHIGETNYSGGRAGDQPAVGLSANLMKLGLKLGRLKTGTPPRVNKRTIDYSHTEEQPGDPHVKFSFDEENIPRLPQVSCHITYTTEETKKIILANIHRSPMYSGKSQELVRVIVPPSKIKSSVFLIKSVIRFF